MIEQQFSGSKINHLLSGFVRAFIISRESAKTIQPGKCAFHDPSKWFWSKSACPVWSGTYLNVNIEVSPYILDKLTAVSAVYKPFSYRWPRVGDLLADRVCHTGIVHPRTAYASAEDESVAVNSYVTFDALYLLVGIKSVVALTVAPLDALGVKCHHRRLGVTAFATNLHDEFFDTMIQIPFQPPLAEIAVHGLLFGNGRGEAYATDIR